MGRQQWSVKQAPRLLRSRNLHIPFQNNKQTNRHSKKNYIWILPVACFVFRYNNNETKQTNQQQSKRNGFSFRRKWLGKSVRCAWVARAPIGREHTFHNRIRRYSPVVEHISCFSFPHEFIHTQTNKQRRRLFWTGLLFSVSVLSICQHEPTNQQTTTETNNKQLTNLRWLPETIKQTNKQNSEQTNKQTR